MQLRYSTVESFNSTYYNNTAHSGGLLHINARSQVIFEMDRFQKNVAKGNGALIHGVEFGYVSFSRVNIDASNSFSSTHATLVFLIDGIFDVESAFFGNPLNTSRSTTLDLKRLVFTMNNTDFMNFYGSDVGAIVRVLEGVETNINGCTFRNNVAELFGGALAFSQSKNVSITHCKFFDNTAISGGAIYAEDSSVMVTDSTFERNKAYLGSFLTQQTTLCAALSCNLVLKLCPSSLIMFNLSICPFICVDANEQEEEAACSGREATFLFSTTPGS